MTVEDALRQARTQHGEPLLAATMRQPVLVVFLRHFGCALCRELVADVARHRQAIADRGVAVAFVHMHPEAMAGPYFTGYGVGDALRISDPEKALYRAFGLLRAAPTHWLSWTVITRYIDAIVRGRHRSGYVGGDVLQMPGAFVVRDGRIVQSFRPERVSDRLDLVRFVA